MAQKISWDDFGKQSKSSGKSIENLKLESGNTYQVRIVGEPVEYHKYFINGKSAVCADPRTCPVKNRHGFEPGSRWAVNVLDRSDNKLKVMECPATALKAAVTWKNIKHRDPGGQFGVDLAIEVTGAGKKKRYNSTTIGDSNFTDDEWKDIEARMYDLEKLYKPVPANEIEARLGLAPSGPAPVQASQNAPQTQAQSAPRPQTGNVGQTTQVQEADIPF